MLPLWYSVLGWLLSIITVAGNGIVIYLIVTRQPLHTTANWFVLSLAIADFCVGFISFITDYFCNALSCNYYLRYAIVSFLYAASATNLCLMTFDRYIAIVKPLKYVTFMTTRRALLLMSAAWLAAFVPHFIIFLMSGILTEAEYSNAVRRFMIFDFVVFETLPLVILPLVTGHIFLIARRHTRHTVALVAQLRFNQRLERSKEASSQRREISAAAKMVGVTVTVFIICYIIEFCYTVIYQLPAKKKPNWFLLYVNLLLYVVNSAVNPVAYAFFKSDIKKSLRSMFCCNRGTREHLHLTFYLKSSAVGQG